MKKGTKEKDHGFPLKTCGNDRGGIGGNDSGGSVGMTTGEPASGGAIPSVMPAVPSVKPDAPFLSFPTFLIGNPAFSPGREHTKKGTKEKDHGFPLKTCGNDRGWVGGNDKGGSAGMTAGEGVPFHPLSPPSRLSCPMPPFCHSRHF